MVIGIDASRAFGRDKTGTENYSYHLIKAILRLPESRPHTFVLFIRPNTIVPAELVGITKVIVKEVKWKYLWTQVGLAWETWFGTKLDVLWVPAHTLPVFRNPRIKTVVTIHGLEYQWLPEYNNWLQRWYLPLSTMYAARSADKLIAVSEFTRKQLEKELHTRLASTRESRRADKKKIKVIHEGVQLDDRHQNLDVSNIITKYGLQDKKYVLFVGTVQPRKNLVALVEAFGLFAALNPDYKLVIAGGIGWMADRVLQAPGEYGVQEKVIFTGRVTDLVLSELYLGAQIYVQPSLTEGFGLPILEAMRAGVAVISSDGGALPEVVGGAGVVVPLLSKDPAFTLRLARAMTKVVGIPQLRTKMIANGKKQVMRLTWQNTAKVTLKVLLDPV